MYVYVCIYMWYVCTYMCAYASFFLCVCACIEVHTYDMDEETRVLLSKKLMSPVIHTIILLINM